MDRTTSMQLAKSRQQELIKEAQERHWMSQMRRRRTSRQVGPLRVLRLQRA